MKRPLGVAVKTIAHPLTDEALAAIEASGLIRTLETNPVNFEGEDGAGLRERFMRLVCRKGIATPTFHGTFGTRQDLSSLDADARRGAVANVIGELSQARDLHAEIVILHPSYEPIPDAEREARKAALKVSLSEIEEIRAENGVGCVFLEYTRTGESDPVLKPLKELRDTLQQNDSSICRSRGALCGS